MPVQSFPYIVSNAVQPRARVYRSTTQALTASTPAIISLDTPYVYIDVGGLWTAGAPTKLLIATQAQVGLYLILAQIGFATGSATLRRLDILVNSAVRAQSSAPHVGAGEFFLQCAVFEWLDLGYFVEMQAYQETAGSLNTVAGFMTQLSMVKLW